MTLLRERAAILGVGLTVKKSIDYGFDYVLYPIALLSFGYLWGTVAMTVASVILNLTLIRFYDWTKRDWLMLETIKGVKERSEESGSPLVRWIAKQGDVAAFVVLSWVEDPVIVTLFLRRGSHSFNGLQGRDWVIFWSSTVLSNLMWAGSLMNRALARSS